MEANATEHEPRDMTTLVVPAVGSVAIFGELPRVGVMDAAGNRCW